MGFYFANSSGADFHAARRRSADRSSYGRQIRRLGKKKYPLYGQYLDYGIWNYGIRSGTVIYGSFVYHLLYWNCRRRIPVAYQCGYPEDSPGRIKGKDICLQGYLCECRYGNACTAYRQTNNFYLCQDIDALPGGGNFSYRHSGSMEKY